MDELNTDDYKPTPSYRRDHLRNDYKDKFKEIETFLEDDMEDLLSESLDLSKSVNENQEYLKRPFYRPVEKESRKSIIELDLKDKIDEVMLDYLYLEEDLVHKNVTLSSPF